MDTINAFGDRAHKKMRHLHLVQNEKRSSYNIIFLFFLFNCVLQPSYLKVADFTVSLVNFIQCAIMVATVIRVPSLFPNLKCRWVSARRPSLGQGVAAAAFECPTAGACSDVCLSVVAHAKKKKKKNRQ